MLSVLDVICRDDRGCWPAIHQSARPDQLLLFFSKMVLLRRVAYSTSSTCNIESTGMCVDLQSTVHSIDQRYDYGFLGDCMFFWSSDVD